jgi:hypothetical protein
MWYRYRADPPRASHAARTIVFVVPACNDGPLFVEHEGMKETGSRRAAWG